MKKLMLGLMLAFAVTAEADTTTADGVKYYVNTKNKVATITGYDSGKPPTNLTGTVEYLGETYIVTSVGQYVFQKCNNLVSISLPFATSIGIGAFVACYSLSSVSLPSATSIGTSVFSSCHALSSVSLPSATSIGTTAFYECSSLTSVSMPMVSTLGESAFESCGSLTSISLPMAVTIGKRAFTDCHLLTSVSLPSATSIGEKAFSDCPLLTSVSLPSATSIGAKAFLRTSLSVLTVNEGMKSAIETNGKSYYSIPDGATIMVFEPLPQTIVKAAEYEAQVLASVMCGDFVLDEDKYLASCAAYGIVPQTRPTAKDYKVVAKDAEIVPEGHIAVSKESIAAPSADTVKVEDNKVQLGVSVLKTVDLTAEKKEWDKVKLTKDNIDVDEEGNIIVKVPVNSAAGFMVIQSKDAVR